MQSEKNMFTLWRKHLLSRVLHAYADWRIGATSAEKHCHKPSDTILLTFDDFATPERVKAILVILKSKQVKAMFFLQGDWAAEHPELVRLIQAGGHSIGNHTATHTVLRGAPTERVEHEIIAANLPKPWLRPPEGRYDDRVRRIAARLGYVLCYWTIDSLDWTGASVREMRYTIMSELRPGAVILFHLNGEHTEELLAPLIDEIQQRGFTLTPLTENWLPQVQL